MACEAEDLTEDVTLEFSLRRVKIDTEIAPVEMIFEEITSRQYASASRSRVRRRCRKYHELVYKLKWFPSHLLRTMTGFPVPTENCKTCGFQYPQGSGAHECPLDAAVGENQNEAEGPLGIGILEGVRQLMNQYTPEPDPALEGPDPNLDEEGKLGGEFIEDEQQKVKTGWMTGDIERLFKKPTFPKPTEPYWIPGGYPGATADGTIDEARASAWATTMSKVTAATQQNFQFGARKPRPSDPPASHTSSRNPSLNGFVPNGYTTANWQSQSFGASNQNPALQRDYNFSPGRPYGWSSAPVSAASVTAPSSGWSVSAPAWHPPSSIATTAVSDYAQQATTRNYPVLNSLSGYPSGQTRSAPTAAAGWASNAPMTNRPSRPGLCLAEARGSANGSVNWYHQCVMPGRGGSAMGSWSQLSAPAGAEAYIKQRSSPPLGGLGAAGPADAAGASCLYQPSGPQGNKITKILNGKAKLVKN